jgi:cell division protein FtsQ
MVAVVRGERASAKPRSKASAQRGAKPARGRSKAGLQSSYYAPKVAAPEHDGLGPRLAIAIAAAVIAAGAIGAVALTHRGEARNPAQTSVLGRLLAPLGFTLRQVQVQGAPDEAKADILRAAALTQGQPILGIPLDDLRKRIERAGWVKEAKVVRLLPDTLIISVVPRTPLVVWQHLGVAHVVDSEGQVIGDADPGRFPDLPLVVGEGAARNAGAILPLLRGRPKLMGLIDALIRVDDRRWDLRLRDGAIIQLPAAGEDSALIQLDQLDQKERVLDLGFERIDLRQPDIVVVRPKAAAKQEPQAGQPAAN